MRWLVIAGLLAGCDNLLGLGETRLIDAGAAPDTCSTCESYTSCRALKTERPLAPSDVYLIGAGSGFRAYCDQTADGGGWTLALKVDGREQTFAYDNMIWQDSTTLATASAGLEPVEAKLETFQAIAFTSLRVVFEYPIGSGDQRSVILPVAAPSLRELFAGPAQITTLGRDAWKGLLGPAASLQLQCNAEGTNVTSPVAKVRIGIVGNNEADCATPDSRLGVGGGGSSCVVPDRQTAGNSACFEADNGDLEAPAFAWVFVR